MKVRAAISKKERAALLRCVQMLWEEAVQRASATGHL
jgi:hypothetical protein